jgi:CheY-like chemotaxis protein
VAKILVIEDNEQNMYLCTFILKNHHHTVLQAYDGHTGIEMAQQELPDLIILDIQLPGLDGYAVAHALKSNPQTTMIPVVAVTSFAMAGDRERVMAAGCEGYIEKPINPDTFIHEIAEKLVHTDHTTP